MYCVPGASGLSGWKVTDVPLALVDTFVSVPVTAGLIARSESADGVGTA